MNTDTLIRALELKIADLEKENHWLRGRLQAAELREQIAKRMADKEKGFLSRIIDKIRSFL